MFASAQPVSSAKDSTFEIRAKELGVRFDGENSKGRDLLARLDDLEMNIELMAKRSQEPKRVKDDDGRLKGFI